MAPFRNTKSKKKRYDDMANNIKCEQLLIYQKIKRISPTFIQLILQTCKIFELSENIQKQSVTNLQCGLHSLMRTHQ